LENVWRCTWKSKLYPAVPLLIEINGILIAPAEVLVGALNILIDWSAEGHRKKGKIG
jgi:hypothetical protein